MDAENGEERAESGGGAAEEFRRRPFHDGIGGVSGIPGASTRDPARLHTPDTAYLSAGNSIRLHSRARRGSLAARMAAPVVVCLALAAVLVCLVVRSRVRDMLLADLHADAADATYMGGMLGRRLIARHDQFLADNPDYPRKAEFRAGDYWLVTQGFVTGRDWEAATGYAADEIAPADALFQAGRRTALAEMGKFLDTPAAGSEIVAMFVLNADDVVLAAVRKGAFRFDAASLRAIPRAGVGGQYEAGNTAVTVDYVEGFDPEPVMRGTAMLFSNDGERARLGTVIVVMRTDSLFSRMNSLVLLLLCLFALLVPALGLACWLSARRVAAPLKRLAGDMQAIAEGDYTRRSAIRDNNEIGLVAQAFNSMVERLRLARLNEAEASRLESDLAIARGIQNNLLPQQTPRVRGFDIHTSYRPAREIGGDYYDFLPVDGEHMGLAVADASGKSIPAALVMSTTRAMLRFVAPGVRSASATLSQVNKILSVDIPRGMFVTMYYVILDPLAGSMLCASAGHNPLFIARVDGAVEQINPGGIALGFDNGDIFDRSIREQRVKLESGDRVLLYTDGVVECVNPANEEYSERRLREFLRRNRDLSSHDFVGALMTDLDRHRGTAEMRDDTTIVTFKLL